jgi:hypothetical protein
MNIFTEQQNKDPAALLLQAYFAHFSYSNSRGKIDATLREATGKSNLVLDDKEWEKCLHKPSTFQLAHDLIYEYAYTCEFCSTRNIMHHPLNLIRL